jgi:hypothetical protein
MIMPSVVDIFSPPKQMIKPCMPLEGCILELRIKSLG